MASSQGNNVHYDPLPLTGDDHQAGGLYNAPPSPDPQVSTFHTPMSGATRDLPGDGHDLPSGAATPRFLGAALYDDGDAQMRHSYASSHNTGAVGSEYGGSSYALNDSLGQTARLTDSNYGGYRDDPSSPYAMDDLSQPRRFMTEKSAMYTAPRDKSKRKVLILAIIAGLILIAAAVILPIYFLVIKNNNKSGSSGSSDSTTGTAKPTSTSKPNTLAVTGGDGSKVTMDDGTTFTYSNKLGGTWYWDESDPFNNGARAQSFSPALNETFKYGIDQVRGVNLGGWLNTEPFISPALYQKYHTDANPCVDEWQLSQHMRNDTAGGGINQMEDHYKTFITEKDFAEIAGAGLNWVRIPIGWWAIETRDGEPFLEGVSWQYFLKAIKWARKYGIRINLDLHAVPGSQNGWNHSGRLGTVNFLNGPMGYANAQRTLDYIRIFAEFISQPQYKDVVPMFGILNEPQAPQFGQDALSRFYMEAYNIVRTAGGVGEGNGPFISIHDGFIPRSQWAGIFPNADRITLDTHPYICFGDQSNAPMSSYKMTPCKTWGALVNNSMGAFGLTNAGEWSNAVTDCGTFLNGVGLGTRYEGTYQGYSNAIGSCKDVINWQSWSDTLKSQTKDFALASMDALQNYFFWTWKIGNSTTSGTVETPHWSYQLGLENGWMPKDPREAIGFCGNTNPWEPPLAAWQTGGSGAGNIPASATDALSWPPPQISNAGPITALPSYTPTGTPKTLPVPTFTKSGGATASAGSGWQNAADQAGMYQPIPTCSYLDPWIGPTAAPPSPLCAGGARRDEIPKPTITGAAVRRR